MLAKPRVVLLVGLLLLVQLAQSVWSQATPAPLGADQVRALIVRWFSLQDSQAPAQDLAAFLDPQGFRLNLAEGEINNSEDFVIWWHAFLHRFPNGSHELSNFKVMPSEEGFEAIMDVDFTSMNGVQVSSFERWKVRDNQGQPVIHSIRVERRY